MEPATAKLSRHEPGPKLTPFASRRENHGGAAADSETIPGSIPIRAPLSEDVDDDEEKESSGTEESEEEEDFQMTTAPFAVESLVGSFTAGNPTFLYEAQSSVRRANGNSSFPVDEMEGAEAADERRISAEDEAVLEEFVPLVAMVREVSSSSPSSSSSASSGFSLVRPVAKLSGDDDEHPPEVIGNEDLVVEEEGESCNVAKVPPFGFSGGLRVVGEFGDVGVVEDEGTDDGGEGSVGTVEDMEGYGEAMTETLCPELVLAKFGETVEETGRKGSEEAVLGQTAEIQNLGSATHGGALRESEWKEQVDCDKGFQVDGDNVLTNAKEDVLKDSSNEPRGSASAEIETKVLADAGEGVLKDSNDKQQVVVSAEIETKVLADDQERVSKDSNDKQQEIANEAVENEILAIGAGGVLKDSNDKKQESAGAEIETKVLADAEEGVFKDSNDKQQDIADAEIGNEVLADAEEGVLKDSNDKQQQEVASPDIETEVLADARECVSNDSNDKEQEIANVAVENEILATGGGGVLKDSNDKKQEAAGAEIETEVLADVEEVVLKDSNDKQQDIANAEIGNEVLANGTGVVWKDSIDKLQEVASEEIEIEVLTDAEEGVSKDSNDKQQDVANAEIGNEVLEGVSISKDSNDKQQHEVASSDIETEVLAEARECVLKDSNDNLQEIANAAVENEILSTGAGGVLKDSNDKKQEAAGAEIETKVLADAEEGVLKDSNGKQQDMANAEIGNVVLANGTGVVWKDSIDKLQEVASAEIEIEVLADAEEGVSKDSDDKQQQEVANPNIEAEVLADAKGVLKDSSDGKQEIANAAIEDEVIANVAGGILKDSSDKQKETANAEIESEVLANAKGVLEDSNDKQQEVSTVEIVDTGKVVDGDTLVAVNSEQELAGAQNETRGIEEAKNEGIHNEDTICTNMATDVPALLDNDLVEDSVVEQEVIKNEKEVDDMGKSEVDDIDEAKMVNGQGVAKEIALNESESMHEHVAESKQEGTHKDESQLKRQPMDEEDIVSIGKLQGHDALLDSDSKQDRVFEEDALNSRKEGMDDKQIETDDLLETKVAHLQATAEEWILEDSNVKQKGADKCGDGQERRENDTQQTNVAEMQAGKEGSSDFESKQKAIYFEEPDTTQKTEADDKRETEAVENKIVKGLDVANVTSREGTKFNLESQTFQGFGQLNEGAELAQREKLGFLEPKKDMESEVQVTNADVSEKAQDGISQPEASTVDSFPLGEVDRNPETKTNFSFSRDEDMEEKYVVDEETMFIDAKPQFKFESSTDNNQSIKNVVGRMVADWEEEADDDDDEDDDEDEEMMDSSALAALMEAASSAGTVSNNPPVGAAGFSVSRRPAGLGSSIPLLDPIPRYLQHSRTNEPAFSRSSALVEDDQDNTDSADGYDETQEKLQTIRVKFLRLVKRLDQSPQNVVVTQVLYRLGLAEGLKRGRSTNGAVSLDRASKIAEELEAAGQEDLDFTCNILVLGKTGVGKSATINSIFDEVKSATNAFRPATNKVQEILGTIHGIKVRVVDTPGLLPSFANQHKNKAIMSSVKKFIKKCPPDIVLYFDRLDVQSRDYSDLPLLKIITETFGAAIWFNAIVVLTHASSAPPDGANGTPLSYEMFMAQRSQIVQHSIRQAAGDMRLMNPVSLVENHLLCRKNREGQSVLPNGQVWKPQLLLLCFSSKVLAEANALLKLQDSTPGRQFGFRTRAPPLPFLLSSLLQSRAQLKVPDEQTGEDIDSDEDLEQLSDSDDEDEYDQLPPFKPLSKYRLSKLTKEQRKAYLDEVDYREKLYQKKQWKEELRRRRNIKKTRGTYKVESDTVDENFEEDITGAAAVAVPMPDMAMPPAFDSDNPTYRYRYLETADQWLVRPVLDTHGWDHDIGYDGVNVEKMLVIGNKVPASISAQITKDKKEANLQLECAASLKHGEHKVTQAGFDVQTVGKGLAYTLRGETRFSNFKCNKTTGGLALAYLGDTLATGVKLEDRIMIGKRLKFVVNGGAMTGGGHLAYGGSLEATLRDKDYPIGQTLSTLGISVMNWHGDFAIGGNLQSQFGIGRKMMIVTRANVNNKGSGQLSIRTSSSEQLQMALIGIIPVIRALIGGRLFGSDSTQ